MNLLGTGSVLADVFGYLNAKDQHVLRGATKQLTSWFDVAADNGSLPFFGDAKAGLAWLNFPVDPKSSEAPTCITANVRNYFYSTMNTYHLTNEAVAAPTLDGNDIFEADGVAVHSFILQSLKCDKLIVTGLIGIKSIENRFCEKVTASEIVFKGDAPQLETVGKHWMLRCVNLVKVSFVGSFPKLTFVDNCWMAECPKLAEVDFKGVTALQKVADRWFFNSPSLAKVDFAPFAGSLTSIGCCWLGHTKVDNLDAKLAVLTNVKEVNTPGQFAPAALKAFANGKAPARE